MFSESSLSSISKKLKLGYMGIPGKILRVGGGGGGGVLVRIEPSRQLLKSSK